MRFERAATIVLAACGFIACVDANPSTDPGGATGSGGTATGGATGSGGTATGGASGVGGAGEAATGGSVSTGGGAGAAGSSGASAGGSSGGSGGTTTGGAGGTSGAGGGAATFHVFLLLGQSNMAGYPDAEPADKVENPRIKVLGFDDCEATGRVKDQWDVAVAPLHECWNGAIGPGDYFSKTLIDELPPDDTIGLVPCALSGEAIETFLKVGGSKYSWIIQRAELAQQEGGVIDGILFHQGESNCSDGSWPGKVNTLVTDLRNDLGLGDAPFLAGELAPTGTCASHNSLVGNLPNVVSNAYVVSAAGLVLDEADTTYDLHFDHDSQVTFGQRYAATMIQALGL